MNLGVGVQRVRLLLYQHLELGQLQDVQVAVHLSQPVERSTNQIVRTEKKTTGIDVCLGKIV